MYKYEIEYIKRMTDILLNTKAEYNDMVSKNSNTIYMEFLSDLYSCFPYDTVDWTSLSEKKKSNALKAFGADMSLLPICIIDNTIMHRAKGGAVFAHDTIHFKNLFEKSDCFYWSDIIKCDIALSKDDVNIFKLENGRDTIQVAKSLAQNFICFREMLCTDSELNKPYIDYINNTINQAADNAKECTDENFHLQLSHTSNILRHILKIMPSYNDEKNQVLKNAVCYCISICDKLCALSNNQISTLPSDDLMECTVYKDIESLYQEMQNLYFDEHYDSSMNNAEELLEKKNYTDALEYIKEAQDFNHTVESDYLQIIVLADSANERNKFNRKDILKVCESVDMNLIPENISQKLTLNVRQYENYINDIKENMLSCIKGFSVNYFTDSAEFMRLSDKYGMTPAMYFVLCDYVFDISEFSGDDKLFILNHKNVFCHSIFDIVSLTSFSKYCNIKLMLDEEFAEREAAFNNEYKWAKRKDTFLKITDNFIDYAKQTADKQYEQAVELEDWERAETIQQSKVNTRYIMNGTERNSAEAMLHDYHNEKYSTYTKMRDKVLADLENLKKHGTGYIELLNLYTTLIAKYEDGTAEKPENLRDLN